MQYSIQRIGAKKYTFIGKFYNSTNPNSTILFSVPFNSV